VSHSSSHDYSANAPARFCQNCGDRLTGPFCAQCGQHDVDYHRSFRLVIHDLLENLFHFEGKLFATVAWLLAAPGRLTNEFIAGRRQRQVNPVRLYLFVSVLFFVGLALLNHGHFVSFDRAAIDQLQLSFGKQGELHLSASTVLGDASTSPEPALDPEHPERPAVVTGGQALQVLQAPASLSGAAPAAKSDDAPSGAVLAERPAEEGVSRTLYDKLTQGTLTFSQILEAMEHRIPTLFFLGVPLFALLLRVVFIGRDRVYIEHLVCSLHLHAWAFLVAMVGSGYSELAALGPDWLSTTFDWAFWLWVLGYVVTSFRRVYGQSWLRAAATVAFVSFVHAWVLFFLGLVLVIGTFVWLAWS
jgi:hypothetical protein